MANAPLTSLERGFVLDQEPENKNHWVLQSQTNLQKTQLCCSKARSLQTNLGFQRQKQKSARKSWLVPASQEKETFKPGQRMVMR